MEQPLDLRRSHEREKYLRLSGRRCLQLLGMRYGATNHGRGAVRLVAAWKPRFVVDFGCGNNAFIRGLRKRGIQGLGIDFAHENADIEAAMHSVPLPDGAADVVTCFDALEHLLPEDVQPVLEEMWRVGAASDEDETNNERRFVFSISTRASRITIDGQNLHPTVRPIEWWLQRISSVATISGIRGRYIYGVWRPDIVRGAEVQDPLQGDVVGRNHNRVSHVRAAMIALVAVVIVLVLTLTNMSGDPQRSLATRIAMQQDGNDVFCWCPLSLPMVMDERVKIDVLPTLDAAAFAFAEHAAAGRDLHVIALVEHAASYLDTPVGEGLRVAGEWQFGEQQFVVLSMEEKDTPLTMYLAKRRG